MQGLFLHPRLHHETNYPPKSFEDAAFSFLAPRLSKGRSHCKKRRGDNPKGYLIAEKRREGGKNRRCCAENFHRATIILNLAKKIRI
jgi:hypothetical protein